MNWKPMLDMPAELRDGRDVLCWYENGGYAVVAAWSDREDLWWPNLKGCGAFVDYELTLYCEITPPTEEGK